jgi:choline-sulfatase
MTARQAATTIAAIATCAGTALALFAAGCGQDLAPRRSILLLTLDTTRTDALSAYDEETGNTPRLDQLSRESVVFEHAITSTPYTGAAHATILTGQLPPEHGLRDFLNQALPEEAVTLPELLKPAGYDTAAFVSTYVLDARYGIGQGFDVYASDFWRQPPSRNYQGYPTGVRVEQAANETVDQALAWLSARPAPDRPFLLWVHLYDPHGPYRPPLAFRRPPPEPGPDRADRTKRQHYYDEVTYMDSEIGRLLDGLRGAGAMDQLIVAVVADHGELLGHFGRPMHTHSSVLWNDVLRVPMMLRVPGEPGGTGWPPGSVDAPVGTVDLMPTLLEAVGIDVPANVSGRSLAPLVAGESEAPRPVYSETFFEHFPKRAKDGNELVSLQLGSFKLIARTSSAELYDLASDPHEQQDLAAERPAIVARMREELDQLRAGWPGSTGGHQLPLQSERDAAEHEARLRALGYVE